MAEKERMLREFKEKGERLEKHAEHERKEPFRTSMYLQSAVLAQVYDHVDVNQVVFQHVNYILEELIKSLETTRKYINLITLGENAPKH